MSDIHQPSFTFSSILCLQEISMASHQVHLDPSFASFFWTSSDCKPKPVSWYLDWSQLNLSAPSNPSSVTFWSAKLEESWRIKHVIFSQLQKFGCANTLLRQGEAKPTSKSWLFCQCVRRNTGGILYELIGVSVCLHAATDISRFSFSVNGLVNVLYVVRAYNPFTFIVFVSLSIKLIRFHWGAKNILYIYTCQASASVWSDLEMTRFYHLLLMSMHTFH